MPRRRRAVDMRYLGQSHELTVPLDGRPDAGSLAEAFRAEHARVYGYAAESLMQVVTARLALTVQVARPAAGDTASGEAGPLRPAGHRRVWFAESGGWTDCPVYDRAALPRDAALRGPAILEQMDTTTVLHPGQALRNDRLGNLIITVQA
jgi:N-methylhydantoinase A